MQKVVTGSIIVISLHYLMCGQAFAEPGPRETVEAADQRIRSLLNKQAPAGSPAAAARDKQLKELVTTLLDLDHMAEKALGREWSKRSDTERREYLELMRQLVERSYLRQAESRTQYQVQYGAVDVDAARGEAEVETVLTIHTRGRREHIDIVYSLTRTDGRWRVTDIETDGASTVRNYRAQFRRIIQQQGFSELLARMRRRLEQGAADI
jgi:phospholipid transport system substrate-binding protein